MSYSFECFAEETHQVTAAEDNNLNLTLNKHTKYTKILYCFLSFIYLFFLKKGREMSFFFVNQLSSRFHVAADVKMVS